MVRFFRTSCRFENMDFLSVLRNNLINCVMMLNYQRARKFTNFKANGILKNHKPFLLNSDIAPIFEALTAQGSLTSIEFGIR